MPNHHSNAESERVFSFFRPIIVLCIITSGFFFYYCYYASGIFFV